MPREQGLHHSNEAEPIGRRLKKRAGGLQCRAIYDSDPNAHPRRHDELKMVELVQAPVVLNGKAARGRDDAFPSRKRRTPLPKKRRSQAPLLEVRQSSIHGRGVYAAEPIRKGKRIIEYKGKVVRWELASEQA